MADPAFMPAVFAAIEAIADGKLAEAAVEHRVTTDDDAEIVVIVELRREVRHFAPMDGR